MADKKTYWAPEGTIVSVFDETGSREEIVFGKAGAVSVENPLHQDALERSEIVSSRKPKES